MIVQEQIQKRLIEAIQQSGMKQKEIAERLDIPLRTVELRIAEALRFLRAHLKTYFNVLVILLNI